MSRSYTLPFSHSSMTSRSLPEGASVQMPYTVRMLGWGCSCSLLYLSPHRVAGVENSNSSMLPA